MNARAREMSERLAWALDLGVAPGPGDPAPKGHSVVEAGTVRADWAAEGFSHLADLRDAIHGVSHPDAVAESLSERWQAEGLYLEFRALSDGKVPPMSEWLDGHPNAAQELARSVPNPDEDTHHR